MSDQYQTFSISSITASQSETFRLQYQALDKHEATASLFEYNSTTQTLTISVGGPDLTSLLSRIRNLFQTRLGRLPNVDRAAQPGEKCKTAADIRAGNVASVGDIS